MHLSGEASSYALLNQSGCVAIDGVDDAHEFNRTRGAMEAIGMDLSQRHGVTATLAAVLLLAQTGFDMNDDEHAFVKSDSAGLLAQIASLLGPEQGGGLADDLSAALTTRRLITRDDEITVPLTLEQAKDSRDALAKTIYGRLFSWLVDVANLKLVDEDGARSFVGVLDIFGFETFKVNSFEQLCINYANERLQQQFNWDVFKSEQAEYESEGIEWKYIEFVDNQACLDLIDRKDQMGVLHLLDEECAIQKGSDTSLAHKLRERHASHAYFDAPKRERDAFTVKHYAGDVTYLCLGFREKNKDSLHPDLASVMAGATSPFVSALFPAADAQSAATAPGGGAAGGGRKGKGKGGKSADRMTVAAQFMSQLASLMRTINETDVRYVRCIKPNVASKPAVFETAHCALQLRCAGVLEAVRISRMAYPNRMPHAALVSRYAVLADKTWQQSHRDRMAQARAAAPGDAETVSLCKALLAIIVDDDSRYQLGKTKVGHMRRPCGDHAANRVRRHAHHLTLTLDVSAHQLLASTHTHADGPWHDDRDRRNTRRSSSVHSFSRRSSSAAPLPSASLPRCCRSTCAPCTRNRNTGRPGPPPSACRLPHGPSLPRRRTRASDRVPSRWLQCGGAPQRGGVRARCAPLCACRAAHALRSPVRGSGRSGAMSALPRCNRPRAGALSANASWRCTTRHCGCRATCG